MHKNKHTKGKKKNCLHTKLRKYYMKKGKSSPSVSAFWCLLQFPFSPRLKFLFFFVTNEIRSHNVLLLRTETSADELPLKQIGAGYSSVPDLHRRLSSGKDKWFLELEENAKTCSSPPYPWQIIRQHKYNMVKMNLMRCTGTGRWIYVCNFPRMRLRTTFLEL